MTTRSAVLMLALAAIVAPLISLGDLRATVFSFAFVAVMIAIAWAFERRRSAPPSPLERIAATGWLLFRRIVCFGAAAFFALAGVAVVLAGFDPKDGALFRLGVGLVLWLLAGYLAFVGIWGHSTYQSVHDDMAEHRENRKRFGWRW